MALLRFLCLTFLVSCVSAVPGTPEKITVTSFNACKMDSKTAFKFEKDKMDMDLEVVSNFDDSLTANVDMETGGEGNWKSAMKSSGPACKLMMQYLGPLVKRTSSSFDPKLPAKCPWKKGMYKLKGLGTNFSRSDLSVPSVPPGLFKISISVKDKNKIVFCAVVLATVKLA